ncbi:MAG: hypothetical protein IKK57_08580 [Clostridia bacterium]|nr:hypothetical protein [Clostridia bacterium]
MEKYLTKKACPGRAVRILENVALLALFALLAGCIWMTASALTLAYRAQLISWRNFLPLLPAAVVVLMMNPIAERIRARHHARILVKALLAADGKLPVDDAEAVTGMRRAAEMAQQLVEKGYLRDVRMTQGYLCLEEAAQALDALAPKEEVKPLFRDAEA